MLPVLVSVVLSSYFSQAQKAGITVFILPWSDNDRAPFYRITVTSVTFIVMGEQPCLSQVLAPARTFGLLSSSHRYILDKVVLIHERLHTV